MKAVLDLTKAIKNKSFYDLQFQGFGTDKNILFVSPQLSSSHLYKFILPFFSFYNNKVRTAITDLSKFSPFEQIVRLDSTITSEEILWANYIVFPFTTMDLSKQNGFYEAVREVNPKCKIVFFVDFNYYELPLDHPHKELFDFKNIIDSTEMNVLMADLCLVSSLNLQGYLYKKFVELANNKYKHIENVPVMFNAIPYLIDDQIVLQNVDIEFSKPESVIKNKDIFQKVADVAEEIKKDDLSSNKAKAKKLSNSKATPKKQYEKTNVVVSKRGRKKKAEIEEVVETKDDKVTENTNAVTDNNTPAVLMENKITENINNVTENNNNNNNIPVVEPIILPKKYRVGVLCSIFNYTDIKIYKDEFIKINDMYGDNVNLIFIGYDYKEDANKILDGVNFEYSEQVSIIQHFKQLQGMELDLIIVPLDRSIYNATSENIDKYLESGLFNIPIMVEDIFPYNAIIINERNGFIYKGKQNFINEFDRVLKNPDLIKAVSMETRKDVMNNYRYTDANIDLISSVYS